jgi:hypothetical protein
MRTRTLNLVCVLAAVWAGVACAATNPPAPKTVGLMLNSTNGVVVAPTNFFARNSIVRSNDLATINAHVANTTGNPHRVTAAMVGAEPAATNAGAAGQVLTREASGSNIWTTLPDGLLGASDATQIAQRVTGEVMATGTASRALGLLNDGGAVVLEDVVTEGSYRTPGTPMVWDSGNGYSCPARDGTLGDFTNMGLLSAELDAAALDALTNHAAATGDAAHPGMVTNNYETVLTLKNGLNSDNNLFTKRGLQLGVFDEGWLGMDAICNTNESDGIPSGAMFMYGFLDAITTLSTNDIPVLHVSGYGQEPSKHNGPATLQRWSSGLVGTEVARIDNTGKFTGSGAGLTNIPLSALATSGASVGQIPKLSATGLVWASDSTGSGAASGSTNLYGTCADRPATAASGTVYYASDGRAIQVSDGARWHGFGPFARTTLPETTNGWVWGSRSQTPDIDVSVTCGEWALLSTVTNAFYINSFVTNLAPPYTATARFVSSAIAAGTTYFGILQRESSGGKMVLQRVYSAWSANVISLTAPGTPAGGVSTTAFAVEGSDIWLRLSDNGTNRTYSMSNNGRHWMTYVTIASTSGTVVVSDQLGVGWNANVGVGVYSGQIATSLLHWEVTVP